MSTPAAVAPAPAKGSKKLIVIIALAVLLLGGGGAAAMLLMKKKSADAEGEGEEAAPAHAAAASHDAKTAPVFVPLDPFTVNLADRDADRYAQIGVTLEIDDSHFADQIKAFMPAIRNNILMIIADRTAADLLGREGKVKLAEKIKRGTLLALGYELDDEADGSDEGAPEKAVEKPDPKKKKKKAKAPPVLPIKAVHFSNFIIQ
jgi:flagellar FliL protein